MTDETEHPRDIAPLAPTSRPSPGFVEPRRSSSTLQQGTGSRDLVPVSSPNGIGSGIDVPMPLIFKLRTIARKAMRLATRAFGRSIQISADFIAQHAARRMLDAWNAYQRTHDFTHIPILFAILVGKFQHSLDRDHLLTAPERDRLSIALIIALQVNHSEDVIVNHPDEIHDLAYALINVSTSNGFDEEFKRKLALFPNNTRPKKRFPPRSGGAPKRPVI